MKRLKKMKCLFERKIKRRSYFKINEMFKKNELKDMLIRTNVKNFYIVEKEEKLKEVKEILKKIKWKEDDKEFLIKEIRKLEEEIEILWKRAEEDPEIKELFEGDKLREDVEIKAEPKTGKFILTRKKK